MGYYARKNKDSEIKIMAHIFELNAILGGTEFAVPPFILQKNLL